MSSRGKIEKWLLSDWSSGHNNHEVLKISDVVIAKSDRKNEEQIVEAEVRTENRNSNANEIASETENNKIQDGDDFSPSTSSWEPTDGSSSSEDSDMEVAQSKTLKMEQYIRQFAKRRNSKKVPTPMHRPNAVVKVLQERQINKNNRSLSDTRKRKYREILTNNKSLPDSTRKNVSPPKDAGETININKIEIFKIKASFDELFQMLNDMKSQSKDQNYTGSHNRDEVVQVSKSKILDENEVVGNASYVEHSDRSQSEESNRSDDNVLITNKYHKARMSPENQQKTDSHKESEWVPIGSGKTLIHKDKYRKVNWKSYTIATRSLLLATFPRRILATHSLTGKRSPAFLNKPPKMCLDPKIVSDIIIEITSKFKVKENLVRGIITTKCADECKMYKMRLRNKNVQLKGLKEQPQKLKAESKKG
ncbi:early boundary activity protein 1-like [Vanessa atalanta]|uniref:early boundary activity protein 1-like n=1 Tax=Vanessa atalanta TaxID=42275 RepID=UPI001FCE2A62|nr:early boundary activity protein 1-like [Vanessa atalanta]XP_047535572.1 early boundary activity protein 1-like [Vanessa atalanta]XP_047535573.1 early boundary activity protein 1-like [Vanessa atalanta]